MVCQDNEMFSISQYQDCRYTLCYMQLILKKRLNSTSENAHNFKKYLYQFQPNIQR